MARSQAALAQSARWHDAADADAGRRNLGDWRSLGWHALEPLVSPMELQVVNASRKLGACKQPKLPLRGGLRGALQ
ncbi:hypothetical protein DF3PA_120012 [Candidatus Defluviicoccus seviourii]|uniref:Uncharacterized protein n=1 Tax=Candidatus Defluviicoccus seviourii TaxID=2565273 RepID=A0A564WAA0_9PROT|nr:hypothetical protein DF3PA_120012 [Candidatus Defluviicoccus seviourii]